MAISYHTRAISGNESFCKSTILGISFLVMFLIMISPIYFLTLYSISEFNSLNLDNLSFIFAIKKDECMAVQPAGRSAGGGFFYSFVISPLS